MKQLFVLIIITVSAHPLVFGQLQAQQFLGENGLSSFQVTNEKVSGVQFTNDGFWVKKWNTTDLSADDSIFVATPQVNGFSLKFKDMVWFQSRYVALFIGKDQRSKNATIFGFDLSNTSSSLKPLFQIEFPTVLAPNQVALSLSHSKQTLAIMGITNESEKGKEWSAVCFNAQFQPFKQVSFMVSSTANYGVDKDSYFFIDDQEGVLKADVKTYFDREIKRQKSSLFLYRPNNNALSELADTLELPNGTCIGSMQLIRNDKGCFLVGKNLLFDNRKIAGIKGLIAVSITPDYHFGAVNFANYSDKTAAYAKKGRNPEEFDAVRPLYEIVSIETTASGAFYVVQERQSVTTVSGSSEVYYGSLIVTKFSADGQKISDDFIAKSQTYKNGAIPIIVPVPGMLLYFSISRNVSNAGFSVETGVEGEQLIVVYNDVLQNKDKLPRLPREQMTALTKSVPFVIKTTLDGSYTQVPMVSSLTAKKSYAIRGAIIENGSVYLLSNTKGLSNVEKWKL